MEVKLQKDYIVIAKSRGLTGQELRDFVDKRVQEALDRHERLAQRSRDKEKSEKDHELQLKKAELEKGELQVKQAELDFEREREREKSGQLDLEQEREKTKQMQMKVDKGESLSESKPEWASGRFRMRYPSMPTFDESKDLMDAYLYRFEQHAKVQNWDPEVWSICLSSHLTGQALDLFESLTDADGKVQYTTLKAELLKQFACTAEDARLTFRRSRPGQSKTGEAIGAELKRHLQTWMDRTEVRTKEGLMDLLLQEQLIDSVSKDLSVFLVEHDAKTFEDMVKLIDRFKQAHPNKPIARKQESTVTAGVGHMPGNYGGGQNRGGGKTSPAKRLRDNYWPYHSNQRSEEPNRSPRKTKTPFKRKRHSPTKRGSCWVCGKTDHKAKDCPTVVDKKSLAKCMAHVVWGTEASSSESSEGHSAKILSSAMKGHIGQLNLEPGTINGKKCSVLRDTGANVCGVRKTLVLDSQYVGKTVKCRSFGGRIEIFQLADVDLECEYKEGTVRFCVLDDPVADVIIGNVPGILETGLQNDQRRAEAAAVVTRARAKHEVNHHSLETCPDVIQISRAELCNRQRADASLADCFDKAKKEKVSSAGTTSDSFHVEDGLLLRTYRVGDKTMEQRTVVCLGLSDLKGIAISFFHRRPDRVGAVNTALKTVSTVGRLWDTEDRVRRNLASTRRRGAGREFLCGSRRRGLLIA
ncbi:hypothetical protein ACOMHN_051022 [Nucella lapillus]